MICAQVSHFFSEKTDSYLSNRYTIVQKIERFTSLLLFLKIFFNLRPKKEQ
ncbi:conserved hypothetical protein [Acinetobacter baumannii]|nr:conserved domain protein [Acinetobacter baumannii 6013150]KGP68228.1 putative N-acetyltransferase YedL [Acinetobacter baumannii AB5075]SYW90642.1 conserved hypothetical protein [Acinetobacter baumannii]